VAPQELDALQPLIKLLTALLETARSLFAKLQEDLAAGTAANPTGAAALSKQLVAALKALDAELHAAVQPMAAHEGPGPQQGQHMRALQQIVQPASALAELGHQVWVLRGFAEEGRLAVAQVAVLRSCAYLGCSNLEQEGGPAAGQGLGSQRCGGCRMAWYCGTACSHADWRAGHKRVCKALAATKPAAAGRGAA
jgi:hypothetical protein